MLKSSPARVIILSMYANPEDVQRALKAGASGYLLKEAAVRELDLAIESMITAAPICLQRSPRPSSPITSAEALGQNGRS